MADPWQLVGLDGSGAEQGCADHMTMTVPVSLPCDVESNLPLLGRLVSGVQPNCVLAMELDLLEMTSSIGVFCRPQ